MRRIVLYLFFALVLNSCSQYNALLGPSLTMATTGSIVRTGGSLAASFTIDQSELIENTSNLRKCQTQHSADLNEIFFTTLDEFDCERNDLSILR